MKIPAPIRLLIVSLLLWGWQPSLYSQPNKHFRQIGADEGLSQSTVLGITQDNQGFIWMATRNGLNRFDGHDFTTFYKDTGSRKLPSGFVKAVFKDSRGDLWIGTSNGLRIYHALNSTFVSADEHLGFATNIPSSAEVWQIYEYPKGCIWLLTIQHGLFICSIEQHTIQHLHKKNSVLQHNWIRAMARNTSGRVFISTPHEVHELKKDKHHLFQVQPPLLTNLRKDAADIGIQDLLFETNNRLWIGCHSSGIAVWDLERQSRQQDVCPYPIRVLYRDRDSGIWAGTFGAGLIYYNHGNTPRQFLRKAFSPGSPGSNFIRSIYQDSQGKIWIGSEEEGASIYNPQLQQIESFEHKDWRLEAFRNVRAIYAEDNEVYIGSTVSQLAVFNLSSQQLERIETPAQSLQHQYDIVTQLLPTPRQLLVATYGSGLLLLNKTTRRLQRIETRLPVKNITRLIPSENGNIWVCTNKGFFRFDPETLLFTDWQAKQPALQFLSSSYIKTVCERGDTLWIATDHQGLFVYDMATQQLLPVVKGTKKMSLSLAVNDFLPGANGIWLATYDNGLLHAVVKGTNIQLNEMPDKDHQPVFRLLQDNQGDIWQSTNKGLCRYTPGSGRSRYFDKSNGTQGQEYYIGAACEDSKGRLWFGGKNGFDCIYPNRITESPPPLPVCISGLRVQEQEFQTDTVIAFRKHITLNHSENFLTISFTSPDYNQPGGCQYIYRMKGVDEQWVRSGNIRQARYTALRGGEYLFEVSTAGPDGKATGAPAALWITIRHPFWNTWLFYTLLAVFITAIIYAIWRYRLLQVEAMYRMRNDISRDLHDDIGGTLSSIHILTEVARQKALQSQGSQAASILEKVNTLALDMVGRMSDTIWAINPANDNPDKLMERLRNQFLPLCSAKGIQLELHSHGTQQAVTPDLNKRKQLYMIAKEILNNALKHAHCSQIVMDASYKSKQFILTVSDNGAGFHQEQVGTGNGLNNLRERINTLKGSLYIKSIPGEGTTITVSIPLP